MKKKVADLNKKRENITKGIMDKKQGKKHAYTHRYIKRNID